jgi:hypothetical protein
MLKIFISEGEFLDEIMARNPTRYSFAACRALYSWYCDNLEDNAAVSLGDILVSWTEYESVGEALQDMNYSDIDELECNKVVIVTSIGSVLVQLL